MSAVDIVVFIPGLSYIVTRTGNYGSTMAMAPWDSIKIQCILIPPYVRHTNSVPVSLSLSEQEHLLKVLITWYSSPSHPISNQTCEVACDPCDNSRSPHTSSCDTPTHSPATRHGSIDLSISGCLHLSKENRLGPTAVPSDRNPCARSPTIFLLFLPRLH